MSSVRYCSNQLLDWVVTQDSSLSQTPLEYAATQKKDENLESTQTEMEHLFTTHSLEEFPTSCQPCGADM